MDDAEAHAPAAGTGTIVLSRVQGGYRDLLRSYTVLIDDTRVGSIARGRTLRFEVPAGMHQLQLKIDWCSSSPFTVVVAPGEMVFFACAPGGDALEGLTAVSINRGDYITLQRTAEPVRMPKTPMDAEMRFLLALAVGFFGGGLTFLAALVWHSTGVALGADKVVAAVSLTVTLVSMIAFKLRKRRTESPLRRR